MDDVLRMVAIAPTRVVKVVMAATLGVEPLAMIPCRNKKT